MSDDAPRVRATGFGARSTPRPRPPAATDRPGPPPTGPAKPADRPRASAEPATAGVTDAVVGEADAIAAALTKAAKAATVAAKAIAGAREAEQTDHDKRLKDLTDPPPVAQARNLATQVHSAALRRNKTRLLGRVKSPPASPDPVVLKSPEECLERIGEFVTRMERTVKPGLSTSPPWLWWTFAGGALRSFFVDLAAVEGHAKTYRTLMLERYARAHRVAVTKLDEDEDAARREWLARRNDLRGRWETVTHQLEAAHPEFASPRWDAWTLPAAPTGHVRIGTLRFSHVDAPWTLPMVTRCPSGPPLLIETAGRPADLSTRIVPLVTRILGGLPAGSVETTLVDPIGLTDTFSELMHLRDYDERLLGDHVVVESRDIDTMLEDLTRHIAHVNAAYLRGAFKTLEEHNAHAGTSATPYRLLVVADFPERFSTDAVKRLTTIAERGAAAGVIVVVHRNTSVELPYGVSLTALEQASVRIRPQAIPSWSTWDGVDTKTTPTVDRPSLAGFELRPDSGLELKVEARADATRFGRLMEAIGSATAASRNRSVPMSDVLRRYAVEVAESPGRHHDVAQVPDVTRPETWWRGSTAKGIAIPLGPASARKTQLLTVGRSGTTQHHVLLAGTTGSGKSTLLRTLITAAAMTYPPDELRFALLDFRNGVGFELFAEEPHPLVHADTIVVDCEREKGIHVLEGLISTMRARERIIREAASIAGRPVDDIATYREVTGKPLARILVIADEFQVLTEGGDSIADEANKRLSTLSKQGRASGIHLLLASQTIGGSGLMADVRKQAVVRIGLQLGEVSESEALFADGNTAAAALAEQGAAIMNTAPSRAPEANEPFTVGHSDTEYMEAFLRGVAARGAGLPRRTRVLDGTGPTRFDRSLALEATLGPMEWTASATTSGVRHSFPRAPARPAPIEGAPVIGTVERLRLEMPVVFGDPLSLRAPAATEIERLSGSNVLHIGGGETHALGVLFGMALPWVHACGPGTGPVVTVLDALRDDATAASREAVERAGKGRIAWVRGRAIGPRVVAIREEVVRRRRIETELAPHLVIVLGLQRADDLREARTSSFNEEPSAIDPARAFEELLSDGSRVGVHVAVWADTAPAASKGLGYESRKEFAYVVGHRMDVSSSETLFGSPQAGDLPDGRALVIAPSRGVESISALLAPEPALIDALLTKFVAS